MMLGLLVALVFAGASLVLIWTLEPHLPEPGIVCAERKLAETQRRAILEAERQKYADTLPAFSVETERNMRREGHLPARKVQGLPANSAAGQAQRELNQARLELNAAMYQPTAASQKELAKSGEYGSQGN